MYLSLTPRIAIIGSGRLGHSLTDAHDSHVYLVDAGEAAFIVDAGCGLATTDIVDNIAASGIDPLQVAVVLLTHAHADHAAGASSLSTALHAQVWSSTAAAMIMRTGDEDANGLRVARRTGIYPDNVVVRPTPVARTLDTETFELGDARVTAIPTPGHSADHVCYLVEVGDTRALFSGDAMFSRGRVARLGTPDTDLQAMHASLRTLAALDVDLLLPGHGSVVLGDVSSHFEPALARIADHQLPEDLIQ